jgi:isopentenyldiphosphate isomerase
MDNRLCRCLQFNKSKLVINRSKMEHKVAAARTKQQYIPGIMRWVQKCNQGESILKDGGSNDTYSLFRPFYSDDGYLVGYCTAGGADPNFTETLRRFPSVFTISSNTHAITIDSSLTTLEERTEAVAAVMKQLHEEGVIKGWRNELYPVSPSFSKPPFLLVERAAAPFLGVKSYGVHINGYVRLDDGTIELWVARRSEDKPTWPGLLDHIVAGGQPYGLSCQENVVKECWEEAGIPKELANKAISVGAVSYTSMQPGALKRDVLFCYDLQLPLEFVPVPQDGEVEGFQRMKLDEVARLISETNEFKDNCNLVIADFLCRHGFLNPDNEPDYLDLIVNLRRGDCS